jgi:hypothetical protein
VANRTIRSAAEASPCFSPALFFWYPSSTQIVPEVYIMRSIQYKRNTLFQAVLDTAHDVHFGYNLGTARVPKEKCGFKTDRQDMFMSVRHLRGKWEREAGEAHEIPRMQKQNCQGTSVIPYSRPYWILRMMYTSGTIWVLLGYQKKIMRSIQYGLE